MPSTPKPVDAGVSVGQVFLGKYRVDAILGHGGMGVVAECTHLALNERVAVKMLRSDVLQDQDAVSRFIREAQAAVKLKSEYVARVSDVGTFENGVPYMVMEFLDGQDLGELLKERGVLGVQWVVELMLQTAEALAEAHSLGIVHRDVKPTNLFVTWRPDGSALIKVLDFGISKSPMGTDMQLTQTQSLLGTPAYMSPEQMRSARLVDSRSDIWSLGTVFYEALEGRRPFEAESFSEMCVKVAVDPPAPMVNTPPGLQQVILRCLAKSPEQRYSNMAEFARDLIPYATDQHQATMLVERMQRMLSRAQYNWEGSSTGASGRTPAPTRQRAQTPPAVWGAGSDPAASPWAAKSEPNAPPWQGHRDGSAPYPKQPMPHEPSQPMQAVVTMDVRQKRRWPLLLGALALLGIGGAIAAVAVSRTDSQPARSEQKAATEIKAATVPVDPPKQQAVEAPAATGSGSAEVKIETKVDTKAETPKPPIKKAQTKTHEVVKTVPKTGQDTKAPETPPQQTPPQQTKPKCDPFASMHDCNNSK